jgi:ATP-dependent DNA ligase
MSLRLASTLLLIAKEHEVRFGVLHERRAAAIAKFVDHIETQGRALFEKACQLDLEGIVAKRKSSV